MLMREYMYNITSPLASESSLPIFNNSDKSLAVVALGCASAICIGVGIAGLAGLIQLPLSVIQAVSEVKNALLNPVAEFHHADVHDQDGLIRLVGQEVDDTISEVD